MVEYPIPHSISICYQDNLWVTPSVSPRLSDRIKVPETSKVALYSPTRVSSNDWSGELCFSRHFKVITVRNLSWLFTNRISSWHAQVNTYGVKNGRPQVTDWA